MELPTVVTRFVAEAVLNRERSSQLKEIVNLAAETRRHFPYGGYGGLDTAELQTLMVVEVLQRPSPSQIAETLNLDRSSISKPVARLEQHGHIKSVDRQEDIRRRHLKMTAKGRRLLDAYLADLGPA